MKIKIEIQDNSMFFSETLTKEQENLNNTNLISVDSVCFSNNYINKNIILVKTFIKMLYLSQNIEKVLICDIDITEIVIKVLDDVDNIKLYFLENNSLNYSLCEILYYAKNISMINCYSMP